MRSFNYLGRGSDELLVGLHSFPFERYVIFYRAIVDGIEVARGLRGARDIDSQFHQDV